MVKVQAIIDFTYKNYDKIQNLESINEKEKGKIFTGDIFEVEEKEAEYLAGNNQKKIVAVEVIIEQEVTEKKTKKKITKKKENI